MKKITIRLERIYDIPVPYFIPFTQGLKHLLNNHLCEESEGMEIVFVNSLPN